jgi:biopolymer transport protein ExbD
MSVEVVHGGGGVGATVHASAQNLRPAASKPATGSDPQRPPHPRRRWKPRPTDEEGQVAPDINTTPLIDVMLVLLVMLLITVPLQQHAVTLATPSALAAPPPSSEPPPPLRLKIAVDGLMQWDGQTLGYVMGSGREPLTQRLQALALRTDPPELQIEPDPATPYGMVAHVLAASRRAGVTRIGVADTATGSRP